MTSDHVHHGPTFSIVLTVLVMVSCFAVGAVAGMMTCQAKVNCVAPVAGEVVKR